VIGDIQRIGPAPAAAFLHAWHPFEMMDLHVILTARTAS
jgi:hypothetical protein